MGFSPPSSRFHRAWVVALATGLVPAGILAAADWSDLMAKSPFGQAAATAAEQAPTELEFRGVVVEGNVRLVNLYDPAAKTSRWIEVNATVAGLQVTDYDSRTNQVRVSRDGRALTLPLKQAHVALLQPAPAAPPKESPDNADPQAREDRRAEFRAQMRARMENGGPMPRNFPPEAEAAIQEIRRRRALRDGTPPPAAATPVLVPAPVAAQPPEQP